MPQQDIRAKVAQIILAMKGPFTATDLAGVLQTMGLRCRPSTVQDVLGDLKSNGYIKFSSQGNGGYGFTVVDRPPEFIWDIG